MTIGFDIRCELEYSLEGQSEFLSNVHAAENSHQTIVTESFDLDGAMSYTQYTNAETGNRFVRAGANGKQLRLTYATSLLVDHYLVPSASINEVPVAQLPNEVLAYVLPSRYCPSDRLVALSTRLFKDLPHGYSRIDAVCDWILPENWAPTLSRRLGQSAEVLAHKSSRPDGRIDSNASRIRAHKAPTEVRTRCDADAALEHHAARSR